MFQTIMNVSRVAKDHPEYYTRMDRIFGEAPSSTIQKLVKSPTRRLFLRSTTPKKDRIQSFQTNKICLDIVTLLGLLGYDQFNWEDGLCSADGKNWKRIGKALQKEKLTTLVKKWKLLNDQEKVTNEPMLVISYNLHDVLSCSTGRSWRTCLHGVGSYYDDHLGTELCKPDGGYSLICYLTHKGDYRIKKPIGRTWLHPYVYDEEDGDRKIYLNRSKSLWYERPARNNIGFFLHDSFYGRFPHYNRKELQTWINKVNKELYSPTMDSAEFTIRSLYNNSLYDEYDEVPTPYKVDSPPPKKRKTETKLKNLNPTFQNVIKHPKMFDPDYWVLIDRPNICTILRAILGRRVREYPLQVAIKRMSFRNIVLLFTEHPSLCGNPTVRGALKSLAHKQGEFRLILNTLCSKERVLSAKLEQTKTRLIEAKTAAKDQQQELLRIQNELAKL